MIAGEVRAHYVALAWCTPLPIAAPGSAVVTVSFTVAYAASQLRGLRGLPGRRRPAALQLRAHGVASIAPHPALVHTTVSGDAGRLLPCLNDLR